MGSLGGSSSTKVDKFTKEITKELMAYGKEVGKIPYQPWTGLDVAAPNTQMDSGMQAFADMGNAFGMGMPTDVTQGRPNTYTDASGATGYSGFPAYVQNLDANRNTAAADRYSKFYDLPVSSLYGSGTIGGTTGGGGVTGVPVPGTGGGGGGGGTTGGKGTAPTQGTTGGKAPLNTGLGNFASLMSGKLSPNQFGAMMRPTSRMEGK